MMKLARPCRGTITSRFGFRFDPFNSKIIKKVWHSGLDIGNQKGTPIGVAYKGNIVFVGERGAYGNCIIVYHPTLGNVWTLYGHLSRFDSITMSNNNIVEQGQIIGYMGSTGASTGNHLHFEVRIGINGYAFAQNPEKFLV